MSCPKCDGFVTYGTEMLAVSPGEDGVWIYYPASCEDCDWEGIGRQWFKRYDDGQVYEDDVDLPLDDPDAIIRFDIEGD